MIPTTTQQRTYGRRMARAHLSKVQSGAKGARYGANFIAGVIASTVVNGMNPFAEHVYAYAILDRLARVRAHGEYQETAERYGKWAWT